jgi:hypothetical protein
MALKIDNLPVQRALDRTALETIHGGRMSFGWLRPYSEISSAPSPLNVFIGRVDVYNLENPVFNTVNQVEYTRVNISNVADSTIASAVTQGQLGFAG